MTTRANILSGLAIAVAALATITLSSNEASAKSSVVRSITAARAAIPVSKARPVSTIKRRNFEIQGLMGRR
jgi:hypothetical protein